MTEVGVGYVRLVPSMRGFSAAASREMANGMSGPADTAGRKAGDGFVSGFGDALQSGGQRISGFGDQMTQKVSLPLLGVGAAALTMSGDFEAGMNKVQALSGATGEELAAMRDLAKDLGSSTQFSASEAAEAMSFLAMAGFDAQQTMEALPGVLNLAAAGGLDLATSADIASNVLSGFGLEVSELTRLNDVLANTMTSSNTNLEQLGSAFQYVGPVASSAGLSLEETAAAIGLLGNAGIQGEQAGTVLRGAIANLLNPSNAVAKAMDRVGLSATDSSGNLLPLHDIISQLEESGASTADMMAIFGVEAGPGMQALVSQGSDALADLTDKAGESGTAAEIAETQMAGFNGGMASLKSAFEGLMIAIGESGLLEWATQAVQALTGFTQQLSETNPEMLRLGTVIAGGLLVLGPFLSILGRIISTVSSVAKGIGTLGRGVGRIAQFAGRGAAALGRLAAAAARAGLAVLRAGAQMIASAARAAARVVASIATQIARWVVLGAQALLHAAKVALAWLISLGPIAILIAAVIAAVALIIANWDKVSAFITTAAQWVWQKVTAIFSAIANWVLARLDDIVGFFAALPGRIWAFITWIYNKHNEVFSLIVQWVKARIDDIVSFFAGLGGRIWGFITAIYDKNVATFNLIRDWIRARIDDVVSYFAALPGRVSGFITSIKTKMTARMTEAKNAVKARINSVVSFFKALPGRVSSAISRIAEKIKAPFRNAFNWIKNKWNSTVGGFGFSVPDWIPGVGGRGFNIPKMHSGGIFNAPRGGGGEGLALLRDGEEVLTPEQRASLNASIGRAGPGAAQHLTLDVTGGSRDLVKVVSKWIRNNAGGDVQLGLGTRRRVRTAGG